MKKKRPDKYQIWVDARKELHLSHAQVQMARELGMNPKKFGKLANHKQEPWKLPLGKFIERIYLKHFKKRCPDTVRSVEKLAERKKEKRETRRQRKVSEKGKDAGPSLSDNRVHQGRVSIEQSLNEA